MDSESREVAVEQVNTKIFGISGDGRTAKLTVALRPTGNMAVSVATHCSPRSFSAQSDISLCSNTTSAWMDLTALLYSSVADYQTQYLES